MALAQDEDTQVTPEGVEWTLATLAGEAVPESVTTTLFMSGGEVVGDAGCNSYFGSYELDGDALTFPTPFGSTLKMCEEEAMAVEDAYLPLLQATASWAIDEEGALSLADADGAVHLVYGEATVDVTASDVDALVATLATCRRRSTRPPPRSPPWRRRPPPSRQQVRQARHGGRATGRHPRQAHHGA